MLNKVQGIVISKLPFKEKDLVASVLLKSGEQLSCLFYGGQGPKKASSLELGTCLNVELSRGHTDLVPVKEWKVHWYHKTIRYHYKSFALMCFFLDIVKKIAPIADSKEEDPQDKSDYIGLYIILSNALHELDKDDKNSKLHLDHHLLTFLVKLLIQQGIFPQLQVCALSGKMIDEKSEVCFSHQNHGFVLTESMPSPSNDHLKDSQQLLYAMKFISGRRYHEFRVLEGDYWYGCHQLVDFFCHEHSIQKNTFKTLKELRPLYKAKHSLATL